MKKYFQLSLLLVLLIPLANCQGQTSIEDEKYTYRRGDPNGIGKWYMGREIAYVMGFQGMRWLERPEREKEERTSVLLENMNIQKDDVIADIGAGSGYHVFKMAGMAAQGKIYAVDIQDEMLAAMRQKIEKGGVSNVDLIKGGNKSVNLPDSVLDKILIVDVYHEFEYPYEIMTSLNKALKPDGKLYLIEYRKEDKSIPIKEVHKMTEKQAIKEMKAVGFKLERNIANLPWQHCMVFVKDQS